MTDLHDKEKGKKIDTFANRVAEMTDYELVATYQYVSGLFARQDEQLLEGRTDTAQDMNILKHEILHRLELGRIKNSDIKVV